MSSRLDVCAFEIRQLMHAQPIVRTVQKTIFGVLKSITEVNLSNKDVVNEIWWPFISKCFEDLCAYGICAYYKKTKNGIATPVHVPISKCMINVGEEIEISPKNTTLNVVPARTKVFVLEEPDDDTQQLNSPFSRLLHQYRRLSELSTSYLEEERRIAKPVNFLEDPNLQQNNLYQAITASNPEWDTGTSYCNIKMKCTYIYFQHVFLKNRCTRASYVCERSFRRLRKNG